MLLLTLLLNRAEAQKQKQQLQEDPDPVSCPPPSATKTASLLADQDQRKTLKFGFSSKGGNSKVREKKTIFCYCMVKFHFVHYLVILLYPKQGLLGNAAKKRKMTVASVFGNDSDDE